MIVVIEFFVNRGVLDSEIGAEIDNAHADLKKWLGKFGSEPVWQREKNDFGVTRELLWINIDKLERLRPFAMRKSRKDLRERLAGELPRSCCDKIDMLMPKQQAYQFFAHVTGSPDQCDFRVLRCHNAQCVFRLSSIAIRLFASGHFRYVHNHGCSLSCWYRGSRGLRVCF